MDPFSDSPFGHGGVLSYLPQAQPFGPDLLTSILFHTDSRRTLRDGWLGIRFSCCTRARGASELERSKFSCSWYDEPLCSSNCRLCSCSARLAGWLSSASCLHPCSPRN